MVEQVMTALVSLWLNTDLDEFGRRFYDGMAPGYIREKFKMFQANPIHWYNSLDWLTKEVVTSYLEEKIDGNHHS